MGTRKTTARAEARARELHAAGKTVRQIAAQLKAEGLRGGKTTISAWLSAKPRATDDADEVAPASPSPDMLELLGRSVRAIEKLSRVAEKEGRLSEFSTLQRTLNQSLALAARLTPPERPDPSAHPDMAALGAQVAQRLHRLIDAAAEVRP